MFYLLLCLSLLCPLLVFLDYRRSHNIYVSIIYVLAFAAVIIGLSYLLKQLAYGMLWLALAVPFLLVLYLAVAQKRKTHHHRTDNRLIDREDVKDE